VSTNRPSSTASSTPRTLSEWRAHVDALEGSALLDEAEAANAIAFVEVLEGEGYAPAQIHAVLHAFARRCAVLGVRPPGGGLYDFAALARRPAPDADDEPKP
jgi:hypothetical protein